PRCQQQTIEKRVFNGLERTIERNTTSVAPFRSQSVEIRSRPVSKIVEIVLGTNGCRNRRDLSFLS
ncbi:MAG TPA: hypothetical protein VIP11_10210, partial [Gemmatimonadaceae bacterium]